MTTSDKTGNRMFMTPVSRRRFAQGLAASPFVFGAASRGVRTTYAQDKIKLVALTHWGRSGAAGSPREDLRGVHAGQPER